MCAVGSHSADSEPKLTRRSGRLRHSAWTVVGLGLVLLKTEALAGLLHHRGLVIAILGLGLVSSVLGTRPVGVTLTAGPLLAFALAPSSTALGIAFGVGAFGLLLAIFFAIGTVLMAREGHRSSPFVRLQRPRDI